MSLRGVNIVDHHRVVIQCARLEQIAALHERMSADDKLLFVVGMETDRWKQVACSLFYGALLELCLHLSCLSPYNLLPPSFLSPSNTTAVFLHAATHA